MPKLLLPKEPTIIPEHPLTMRGVFRDGEKWLRLDHEIVNAVQRGNGTTWGGDPRYAIYSHPLPTPKGRWMLVRLAHNGRYVVERAYPGDRFTTSPEFQNQLLRDLAEHDTRRGWDPAEEVARHNAKLEADRDAEFSAYTQDFADHYLYRALKKAGADAYL